TVTQGIPELRDKVRAGVQALYPGHDREVLITSGTSGALVLALCCTVNPGDEVLVLDPYFVMYPHLIALASGTVTYVRTYPDFAPDLHQVPGPLTPRPKATPLTTPATPPGRVRPGQVGRELARLAGERDVLLVSDEISRAFCYDAPFPSPAEFNEDVLV